jgi:hypothetical protein
MPNKYSASDVADLYKTMGVVHINRQNGFVVRGMRLSPFYVDGMRISTSVHGMRMVTEMMAAKLEPETFDVVSAPVLAGYLCKRPCKQI